jgi:nucleotide-binding universal stress UspA family protein
LSLLIKEEDYHVHSVLHPTDGSEASLSAFFHALAIAAHRGAELTLLHSRGRRATDSWPGFPGVRDTLARWRVRGTTRLIEDNIRRSRVSKREVEDRDPVASSMTHLERHRIDMIVMATEGRSGLARLAQPSRAEKLARQSRLFTLFVPHGCRPFVSGETGAVTLRRILLPIDPATDPRPAMIRAVRSAELLDDPDLEITLLHVGEGEEADVGELPELPFCRWSAARRSGDPAEQILALADELSADAIYMSTSWSRPSLGGSEGGVTEAVLREAECPVAAVPVSR